MFKSFENVIEKLLERTENAEYQLKAIEHKLKDMDSNNCAAFWVTFIMRVVVIALLIRLVYVCEVL